MEVKRMGVILPTGQSETVNLRSDIVVDHIGGYGGDWLAVDAARVSTKHAEGSGPREITSNLDRGLIRALLRQRHKAPFQHGGLTFYVEAPIFVFREWRTHRIAMVQSTDDFAYSEASARYRPLKPEFYFPAEDRPLMKADGFKAMAPTFLPAEPALRKMIAEQVLWSYNASWNTYRNLLESGVAPEMARMVMPVGVYSAMYVSGNPLSFINFLSLRTHEPAATFVSYPQWEIEVAARAAEEVFRSGWPVTWSMWNEAGRIS